MLIEQTHNDLRFLADVNSITNSLESIAHSLAVITGIAQHKFGIVPPSSPSPKLEEPSVGEVNPTIPPMSDTDPF